MNQIITISREFGSGGREFGRRLSENLGFAYYDQEIVQEIAKRTELSERYVQQVMGHRPISSYPIHIGRSFRMMADPHLDQSQNIYREQCNILREMAPHQRRQPPPGGLLRILHRSEVGRPHPLRPVHQHHPGHR